MNLILLEDHQLQNDQQAVLKGRAFRHLRDILKAEKGKELEVGMIGGRVGTGTVLKIGTSSATMKVAFTKNPPRPSPVRLVLAMPRPIVFNRLLPQITALGIKELVLLQTNRVEKSYWSSPVLHPDKMKAQMLLGLEQAKDTVLPVVEVRKRFKPFVEDELQSFANGSKMLCAHPEEGKVLSPAGKVKKYTLLIGPEGGFVPYEVDLLKKQGVEMVNLGERILRVETAVVGCLSVLNQGGNNC